MVMSCRGTWISRTHTTTSAAYASANRESAVLATAICTFSSCKTKKKRLGLRRNASGTSERERRSSSQKKIPIAIGIWDGTCVYPSVLGKKFPACTQS